MLNQNIHDLGKGWLYFTKLRPRAKPDALHALFYNAAQLFPLARVELVSVKGCGCAHVSTRLGLVVCHL